MVSVGADAAMIVNEWVRPCANKTLFITVAVGVESPGQFAGP